MPTAPNKSGKPPERNRLGMPVKENRLGEPLKEIFWMICFKVLNFIIKYGIINL